MGFLHLPDPWYAAKILASGSLVAVTGLAGLLYTFQTSIIYPASLPQGSRTVVATPSEFGIPYEDITLTSPDGIKLKAYLMLQKPNEKTYSSFSSGEEGSKGGPVGPPTIFLLHANAGNMGHRIPIAKVFYNNLKCNVFMLSYRGYGLSEGTPNEKGIRLDAQP